MLLLIKVSEEIFFFQIFIHEKSLFQYVGFIFCNKFLYLFLNFSDCQAGIFIRIIEFCQFFQRNHSIQIDGSITVGQKRLTLLTDSQKFRGADFFVFFLYICRNLIKIQFRIKTTVGHKKMAISKQVFRHGDTLFCYGSFK